MDRKSTLALILCALIFIIWNKAYYQPREAAWQAAHPLPSPTATASSGPTTVAPTSASVAPPQMHGGTWGSGHPASSAIESKPLPTGTGDALVGNGDAFFMGWDLKSYRLGISEKASAVDLRSVTNQEAEGELSFDDAGLVPQDIRGTLTKTASGSLLWTYENADIKLSREFTSNVSQNWVDVRLTAEFKTKAPAFAKLSLTSHTIPDDPEARDRQLLYYTNESLERVTLKKEGVERKEIATPVKYIGAQNRYFLIAMVAQGPIEPKGLVEPVPGTDIGRVNLMYPVTGKSITIPIRFFFGPKDLEILRSVDPNLAHALSFGSFLNPIAIFLLQLLKIFHGWVKNYGFAIILLTVLLKLVTYPLTYKSMKSMKEMAKLQPQLAKLREKYKDDREALNREMMIVMRSHGYNPAAGCLPMLIQMPVFFALYRVLYGSIDLYHQPFVLWIHDLSAKDPLYVTPVLMSVLMFVQQKITPNTATDPTQQKMMQFMPLIFGAFMLTLPSGLTLYMLVNSLASIVQQRYLNKKLA